MLVERFKNEKGQLFIKFPLINNLPNDRGWATTAEANERYARTAIGTPLTLVRDRSETKYNDYHPFLEGGNESNIKSQIDYAYQYAIGQIVDVTQDSGSYKAASNEVPWFGIANILDPAAKEELSKPDSKLVPQGFSPGILHLSGPDSAISEYHIVHVALVPRGAYGPKFVTISKCAGSQLQCAPILRSATSLESIHAEILSTAEATQFEGLQEEPLENPVIWMATIDGKNCGVCERLNGGVFNRDEAERHFPAHEHCRCQLQTEFDIRGASYISSKAKRSKSKSKKQSPKQKSASSTKNYCVKMALSSLVGNSEQNSSNMSFSSNSTPGPSSFGSGTVSTTLPSTTNAMTTTTNAEQPIAQKPKLRLRRLGANPTLSLSKEPGNGNNNGEGEENGNGNQTGTPETKEDQSFRSSGYWKELQQLKEQVKNQGNQYAQREKRYALEKIIPPQLFTSTDKHGHTKFRQREWEAEIERAMSENVPFRFLQDYYQTKLQALQLPELEEHRQTKRASSAYYYNPAPVPRGASASSQDLDEDQTRQMKLRELGKLVRGF